MTVDEDRHYQNGEESKSGRAGSAFLCGSAGYHAKPQELTLSYLCQNNFKKEKQTSFPFPSDDKHVARDFFSVKEENDASHSSKRKLPVGYEHEDRVENQKKGKLGSGLNLSLALPEVAADSASKQNFSGEFPPSNDCSEDFTVSYTYSHHVSHNPSCSLTLNSDRFDCSVGKEDQIWCGGEGTNGSVHSRFRPIGDGAVALTTDIRFGKDSCNENLHRSTSSDNVSFFPSELPAKLCLDASSGDSRKWESEKVINFEAVDVGGRGRKSSRPERILREIVSESIPVVAQVIQEVSKETLESTKKYLGNVIVIPDRKNELVRLQSTLERRSDLTMEALLKCQKDQLEILVALKMGLEIFISGTVDLPAKDLAEIFLYMKCRNINCKSMLPVDDCECKFCSGMKGFCSSCMCPVCKQFDCASNTCSWIGCDVCSHWCHASCGLENNLIRPGPSLNGPSGASEMQFNCIGCHHSSEMFGFVKDVFLCCARNWGMDTLVKEIHCVKKIFMGSQDLRGIKLHKMTTDVLANLGNKTISASDAYDIIIQFFNYGACEILESVMPARGITLSNRSSLNDLREKPSTVIHMNAPKTAAVGTKMAGIDGFDSLEKIIRIKEAEARMFQDKADEAWRDAIKYRRMARSESEKLEKEHADKLIKLCMRESEERRRRTMEELKLLENSHCDYQNMKLRMQSEISSLLERMEATKDNWM